MIDDPVPTIEEYVAKKVAESPPLTPELVARLRALFSLRTPRPPT